MRIIQWVLISVFLASCATKTPAILPQIQYSTADLQTKGRSLASEGEKKETKSYLAMDLPYPAFEKIRKNLESKQNLTLLNRGEAHITVISPPEYKKMQKKISMQQINALADEMDLSHSPYKLLCVGKGTIREPEPKSTYYVVVESDRLFQIRKAIQMLYIKKGGRADDFNPELFFPHVTLGFTDRDLHYEDGVIKDASSCIYSLSPSHE